MESKVLKGLYDIIVLSFYQQMFFTTQGPINMTWKGEPIMGNKTEGLHSALCFKKYIYVQLFYAVANFFKEQLHRYDKKMQNL